MQKWNKQKTETQEKFVVKKKWKKNKKTGVNGRKEEREKHKQKRNDI